MIVGIISLSIYVVKNIRPSNNVPVESLINEILPTPFNPFPYSPPVIPAKRAYLTYIVGDSMVQALGTNANILRENLIKLYPSNEFVNYNYGFGSTNMLSLDKRLNTETEYEGSKFPSILSQGFDLIIIESFAYNPLSEYPLAEGLMVYESALDQNIKQIIKARPDSVVALMTPISPNKESFAKFSRDLSPEVRKEWVNERVAYINKLIEYANKNNIPLINVYERSLTPDGDGDLKYINPNDYIHPSPEGIELMAKTISEFIYENNIFPR